MLTQVQETTFIATVDGDFQSLSSRCSYLLPNLKKLKFDNFSGVWRPSIGEFHLDLENYSLEKLMVDIKPVNLMVDEKTMEFFVVQVKMLHKSEQRLYKVSLDLSYVTIINDSDLEGFVHRKDYLRVLLDVRNLKQLEFFVTENTDSRNRIIMLDE